MPRFAPVTMMHASCIGPPGVYAAAAAVARWVRGVPTLWNRDVAAFWKRDGDEMVKLVAFVVMHAMLCGVWRRG